MPVTRSFRRSRNESSGATLKVKQTSVDEFSLPEGLIDHFECRAAVPVPVTLRQKVYALLDSTVPASSEALAQATTVISVAIFCLIAISIVVFCVESHPEFWQQDNWALFGIEAFCIVVFSLEFGIKFALTPDRREFCQSLFNVIDLASILPFYIDLFVTRIGGAESHLDSLVFLRVVRLARVFRVFKLGKYSTGLQLVIYALRQSGEALSLLAFLLGIGLVLSASLIFIAEQAQSTFDDKRQVWIYHNTTSVLLFAGQDSQFQSIPASLWWALVTLATVGYGDQVPRTWAGKTVGFVTMLGGVLVLAFPVILISNNFSEAVKEFSERERLQNADLPVFCAAEDAESAGTSDVTDEAEHRQTFPCPAPESPRAYAGGGDASPPVLRLSQALPSAFASEPAPGTVVAHFRFGGRTRPVLYTSRVGSDNYQFRYEPIFAVPMDRQGNVAAAPAVDEGIGQFLLRVDLLLDHEQVQAMAVDAVARTGLFDRRKVGRTNCFAFQLAKITASIPALPRGATLLTREFAGPGTRLDLVIAADSMQGHEALRAALPECFVHCGCSASFAGGPDAPPDFEVTVPLLLSLHSRSNLTPAENAEGTPVTPALLRCSRSPSVSDSSRLAPQPPA
eukprot:TRINITY_DN3594_c0_g3_i1.p1 TRINITY_DN3594_c0_g3~~TRINITY_DN3594_c0_g3_i1.p1  ORF type:complete len:623 (+),score=218.84 TRINITY_DN3594_c0_g3_i1:71-1939(+)